jgi:hypothetical protein
MPLTVNYYFTSSLLTKVTEVSEVKFDTGSEGDYYAVYSSIKSSLSTTYGSSITEYEYITSTGTEEGLLPYDQENAAYAQQIGEAVFNGQAKLHCEFESGTTLVVFEAYKNVSTGRVAFFRTYEPRG